MSLRVPGRFAFPRRERLTRKREYERVFREGVKRVGRAFICYQARTGDEGRKIGYVVSRRVGNAVIRNRVKRYVRETYRLHRTDLPPDVHVVVVARPRAAALSFQECEASIRGLFGGRDD